MHGKRPNPSLMYAVFCSDEPEGMTPTRVLTTAWDEDTAVATIQLGDGHTTAVWIGRDDYNYYANLITNYLEHRRDYE